MRRKPDQEAAAVWVAIADLRPWDQNPRLNEPAVAKVADSIKRFGFGAPILARPGGELIAGHTRLKAALKLGLDRVPVRYLDLDPTEAKLLALADNKLAEIAEWDEALLAEVLAEAQAVGGDVAGLGWSDDALSELLARAEASVRGTGEDANEDVDEGPLPAGTWTVETADIKAPFPWFGGKSRAAGLIWARLGDVASYAEPFAGSLAVLLGRPDEPGIETVNDLDGFVSNFWRAVGADPEAVAHHADWPVNEIDLTARHLWLVNHRDELTDRLHADPDYHDAKIAGWWCWGLCCWIGGGWCSGQGPWTLVDGKVTDTRMLPDGSAGRGVSRRRVHLGNAGQGVHRQLVHLGDAGVGVHRQLVHLGNAGVGDACTGEQGLYAWFEALAERLRRVRVCCGDWSRIVTPAVLYSSRGAQDITGVVLDPPYSEGERAMGLYAQDSGSVAGQVREWAIAHGEDPRLRIALCGYDTEHTMPDTWTAVPWTASGGYGSQAKDLANRNRFREVVWFNKSCLQPPAATE